MLRLSGNILLSLDYASQEQMDSHVYFLISELKEHVSAPVQAGDVLGEVILLQDGEELERREIVAADSVERKGISDIFRDLLGYLLMKKHVSW